MPTTFRKRYEDDDFDDAFDENGVLKTGRGWKVPTRMLDGMSREVADHFRDARVVDTSGSSGLALQRAGFRTLDDAAFRDARREVEHAHQTYRDEISEAWRSPPTGAGSGEFVGEREGDLVTVGFVPGRLRYDHHGNLVGVPDHPSGERDTRTLDQIIDDHTLRMREEYMRYDCDVMTAYKRP